MRVMLIPIALLAAAAAHQPAHADEGQPARAVVPYGDLDLARPQDVVRLRYRISRAIMQVCGDPSPTNLHMLGLTARCRRETARRMDIQVAQVVRGKRAVAAEHRNMRVPISDLDLGRMRDRRMLEKRLARAAEQVCSAGGRSCRVVLRNNAPVTRATENRASPIKA